MSPLSDPNPASTSSKRSAFERAMERFVVFVGHAAMGILLIGMGWVFLASLGMLMNPGLWLWKWANPQTSPLGPGNRATDEFYRVRRVGVRSGIGGDR